MPRYNDITIRPNPNNKGNAERTSQVYRGISTVNPDNRNYSTYDINLIKQDIINHFHIRKGEKINNADFGTIIWNILYDPLTDNVKEAVAKDVTDILNNDPRVTLDGVQLIEQEYGLQIVASVTYKNYNISETLRLNFDRDNGFSAN